MSMWCKPWWRSALNWLREEWASFQFHCLGGIEAQRADMAAHDAQMAQWMKEDRALLAGMDLTSLPVDNRGIAILPEGMNPHFAVVVNMPSTTDNGCWIQRTLGNWEFERYNVAEEDAQHE